MPALSRLGQASRLFLGLLLLFSIAALQHRIQMVFSKPSLLEQKLNSKSEKPFQLVDTQHNLSSKRNHLQEEDTNVTKRPNIKQHLDILGPPMAAVQQWPYGIRWAQFYPVVPRAF